MARVFIDGQAGTTGLEISERLGTRDDVALLTIDAARRKDPAARRELMAEADITILCLPDAAAEEAVALAGDDVRILDASTAHRTDPTWVYGLPELDGSQRERIAAARRVSNPGCYAQGFILLVRPLIDAGWLSPDALLSVFGLSGYSGGGRQMIEAYQAFTPDQAEAWNSRSYSLAQSHKHLPEMREFAGLTHTPVFCPTVATYYRGMLIEIPLHREALAQAADGGELAALYADRYQGEAFIEVAGFQPECLLDGGYLNATALNGTNRMQLMVFGNDERYLLVARYDNLGKGASGAAVQNLNLMLGVAESRGLAA
ncbi:MAG: N-acetyl-gamma-glutamyl-phosphate reductase [Gammaproteobacteria bacterium]